jgi:hypothetical protein
MQFLVNGVAEMLRHFFISGRSHPKHKQTHKTTPNKWREETRRGREHRGTRRGGTQKRNGAKEKTINIEVIYVIVYVFI